MGLKLRCLGKGHLLADASVGAQRRGPTEVGPRSLRRGCRLADVFGAGSDEAGSVDVRNTAN